MNDKFVTEWISCHDNKSFKKYNDKYALNNNQHNLAGDMFTIDDFKYAIEFENNNPGIYPTINRDDLFDNFMKHLDTLQSDNMQKILLSLCPNTWVIGDDITRLFNLWNQLPELKKIVYTYGRLNLYIQ